MDEDRRGPEGSSVALRVRVSSESQHTCRPRSCLDGWKHGRRREFDLPRLVAERPEVYALTSCFGVA
jgi:hypothetical protein